MLCRACYGVLRFIMESGAKGCEVIVSGKLRAQRAKAMKFKDGYMIASGHPAVEYIDGCVRHVMLRQGVLGIKVQKSIFASCPSSATCCCVCQYVQIALYQSAKHTLHLWTACSLSVSSAHSICLSHQLHFTSHLLCRCNTSA